MFRLLAVALGGWAVLVTFAWARLDFIASACAEGARYKFAASSGCKYKLPQDLALSPDGRELYVAEVQANRIAVLDAATLAFKGAIGEGILVAPHDISVGSDGRLYVTDTTNRRIAIFRGDGALVGELKADLVSPEGVLSHPNGRIYVGDDDGGKVVAFENGKIVAEVKGLSRPHDVVASGADVIVIESGAHRLTLLSASLERKGRIAPDHRFEGPRYMSVGSDGSLAVAEKMGHRITLLTPGGAPLGQVGSGSKGLGRERFSYPEGALMAGDSLYVSDSGNGRIVRFVREPEAPPSTAGRS